MSPGDVCRVRLLMAVRRDKKLWSGHADAAVHARRLFERMTLLPVSHLPSDDSLFCLQTRQQPPVSSIVEHH